MPSSKPLRAEAACSREEPQPKLWPATMAEPFGNWPLLSFSLRSVRLAKAYWGVSEGRTVAM